MSKANRRSREEIIGKRLASRQVKVHPATRSREVGRSKYTPHQGDGECARRAGRS